MAWLGVCGEVLTTLVIFEDDTTDAKRYVKVLSVARKCGKNMLGSHWIYEQDFTLIDWCANPDHFPDSISKVRWSPNLCPLNDSLWNELADSMDWKNIKTMVTLIDEIRRSVKIIEKEKI